MRLIANALNNEFLPTVVESCDCEELEGIELAVAYCTALPEIMALAEKRGVPITLFALIDKEGFPHIELARKFVRNSPASWQLYLTRDHYHPKLYWFRGVGLYVGSANLTAAAWKANVECGVWFDQDELDREGWTTELPSMLDAIQQRSVQASEAHIEMLVNLRRLRSDVKRASERFDRRAADLLSDVPGGDSPQLVGRSRTQRHSLARERFIKQWHEGLTVLKKLASIMGEYDQPGWVGSDVPATILQDQATEFWYDDEIRRSGNAVARVWELHAVNKRDPERAVRRAFQEWSEFNGGGKWDFWVNQAPGELRQLLRPESLRALDQQSLSRVMFLCHSGRAHARQIKNSTLGLPAGHKTDEAGRCDIFARYLLGQNSPGGETIRSLLEFALWGDRADSSVASRLWQSEKSSRWKIPHVGVSILGELVGYARPGEFPPRNMRVAKALTAFGFTGLRF